MSRFHRIFTKSTFLLLTAAFLSSPALSRTAEEADTLVMGYTLDEIVITDRSAHQRLEEIQPGLERLEVTQLSKLPALFGERDVIKAMQLLPGIKAEGDGSSGYQVRGGTSAQNLILLDGATVYNAGHLMGIFSIFNDNAIAQASIFKGQIPASYGDAVASVLDVSTKTGNRRSYHGSASIGLLAAKLYVEGPIVKDKLSFFVSARRSYLDMFLKLTDDYKDNTLNFYDINAKLSWLISSDDVLSVSFLHGRDNIGMVDVMDMKWGNTALSANYFHRFGDSLKSNTSLVGSSYQSQAGIDVLNTQYDISGFIRHLSLKEDLEWQLSDPLRLNLGYETQLIQLTSAEWTIGALHQKEKRRYWENNLWADATWSLPKDITLQAGLRLQTFSALGGAPYYDIDSNGNIVDTLTYSAGKIVKTWPSVQPRVSANWLIDGRQSIKIGYTESSQNVMAIGTASMSIPFDRYMAASNIIHPQTARQISAGYTYLLRDGRYEFSADAYYKAVDHVYDYRDGKSLTSEIEIERIVLGGRGRAYGLELCARKNAGRLTGWLSYTLSWAENKIEGINNGNWYPAYNDRRHDISLAAMYAISDKWELSAAWVFNTGQALTAPSAKYSIGDETYYYYAERSGYRAPSYHRLDLSCTYSRQHKWGETQWAFGLYNAYNRYNPFIIMFQNDDTKPSGTKTVQYSLFGILPSVSFSISF